MKRDIKWLMQWIEEYENEVIEEHKDELDGSVLMHSHGKLSAIKKIKQKIDQLEVLSLPVSKQEELEMEIQGLIETHKQKNGSYSNLKNGWIGSFISDLELEMKIQELIYKQESGSYSNLRKWFL